MGRSPCCEKAHTNKGAWSPEEDQLLLDYILRHGQGCWRSLPKAAGLLRCGKSCRLRWMNYLRPDLKRGNFTDEEDELIIKLHCLLGNKWSLIAGRLPGRTDNEIKNYWNTHIKRKLLSRGVNPQTHRPLTAFGAEPTTPDKPQPELKMTPLTNPASILPVLETSSASQSQIIDFGSARCPDARFSGGSGDSSSMEGGTCSSGTTATTDDGGQLSFRENRLREKEGIDLELSIGLLGFRSKKANSNACSPATQELELVPDPPAPAPGDTAAVKGVCLCWQLGFQGGQLCKRNCQTAPKIVL